MRSWLKLFLYNVELLSQILHCYIVVGLKWHNDYNVMRYFHKYYRISLTNDQLTSLKELFNNTKYDVNNETVVSLLKSSAWSTLSLRRTFSKETIFQETIWFAVDKTYHDTLYLFVICNNNVRKILTIQSRI